MFDFLYEKRNCGSEHFGEHWCGPKRLPHGEYVLIARYEPDCEDGEAAEVRCCAMPARFYTITVPGSGVVLSTGSGMDKLTAEIATAISEGMLSVRAMAEAEGRE